MTLWYEGPLAALALRSRQPGPGGEDGGADPEADRLTAAALVTQETGHTAVRAHSWTVAPCGAAGPVVEALARALTCGPVRGRPLAVAHAPYDLTLLDRELRRHRHTPLTGYLGGRSLCVLDPVLLHRHLNRGAGGPSGPEDLSGLSARYGTPAPAAAACPPGQEPPGPPESDAVAALELVRALGRHFAPRLAPLTPAALHTLQAVWFAAEVRGASAWFAPRTNPGAVSPAWPLRPAVAA